MRPKPPYRIVYVPIPLPEEFPLLGGSLAAQGDAPITYLHGHDCLEIGYCYEGAGVFVIGGKVLPFRAGAVSIITPAEFHLARSMGGTQSKWAWLYLDPARLLQAPHPNLGYVKTGHLRGKSFCNIIVPSVDPFIGDLVRQIVDELREKPCDYQMAIRGLVSTLMVRFNRLAPKRIRPVTIDINQAIHRIAPALDLIAGRYAEQIAIKEWARSCHLSATHFRRLFRQALGQSPHQYLMELRVRMAATRLQATNEKIITISDEVGFATLSSFNRAFRNLMKQTPREWRRQKS